MGAWELIKSDLYRYHGKTDTRNLLKAFFLIEGFRYMLFFRLCAGSTGLVRMWWRLILRHYSYKYGFQIPHTTKVGKGFYIGHFGTVVVNGNATIGDNVNISPGVVIGQVSRGRSKGVPTIGNKVWIGSNAIIVGNITVGNDVLIAPGAYVNTDVPAGSLVMGNPAVISVGKGVEGYIMNEWGL